MRIPVIAGNWKLFKTIGESVALVNELKQLVADRQGVEIIVAPVFTALSRVSDAIGGSNIRLAAQDCFWEEEGAFTGEVAPKLLKDAGCSHVIVGHSERFSVIETQITGGLAGFEARAFAHVVIAYEPVWAIGTGKTASDVQAQEVHAYIRRLITRLFGQAVADAVRILYGGSVKPDNVKSLMAQPDIDGALVGGASLKPDSFAAIVNF